MLSAGTRLGRYEIVAPLGAGGMGEVYRATDSKLKREVAIKILPPALAADPERLARFQREAEVLASLNHPSIAQIYGLEDSDGVQALVMELVEGEGLAQRIARGPIPLDEALLIAKQMAEALEAACEKGVIHRDLKPDNIRLRPNGTVKVLDFGLAKLAKASDSGLKAPDLSQSPTMASPALTQMGVILGTAAYMSPEQARGMAVDKRTDIWAFGCVLYEMLSGRPAFGGETIADRIAKILEREPDWQALPASTPARVRDLLRRCLDRDQQRRLHDIADARIEIEEVRTALSGPRRVVGLRVTAGGAALALTILAGAWWYAGRSNSSLQHEPVSVIIADFQNGTGDPTFDGTLELMLKLAIEGAGFISAYDRSGILRSLAVSPPDKMDERAAQEIAVRQGVNYVLSGLLERQGSSYGVSVKATQAASGNVRTTVNDKASNKDQVLGVVRKLAIAVREALGDHLSDSDRRFAMDTLSATSLEAVHDYAAAMEAMSRGKFEQALQGFSKAVALDPNFGLGYGGLAIASLNLGRRQDAEKYMKVAVQHLGTGRERYRTRGMYYFYDGDYRQCVVEYGDLIARYPADASASNNFAMCSALLRDMPRAVDGMRHSVKILPNRTMYQVNLSQYLAYSSDFPAAERQARSIKQPGLFELLVLASAQIGQGHVSDAEETYRALGKVDDQGASYTASGLADVAVFEGRFSDAARLLREGISADLSSKDPDRAANQFAALAHTELLRGQKKDATAAAEKALEISNASNIRFLAGRVFVEADGIPRARTLAASLASELQAERQAYAKMIEGNILLKSGDAREAAKSFIDANALIDTWIGHFDLGRAYLAAGAFTQADSEFDRCIKRRGEALSLFLDEQPTYGFFPPVYYYQGLVREGLNSAKFADSYRAYLEIRGRSSEDPLVPEVRRRAGR